MRRWFSSARSFALVVVTVTGLAAVTNTGLPSAVASHRAAPPVGMQLAELAGSGTVAGDWFGASVAVSSSTIVVGAPTAPLLPSGVGRAYVFAKTATGWHQSAELEGPDALGPDWFGDSVAVSGSTIVVGAFGHASEAGRAYLFTQDSNGWHQAAELSGSGTVPGDGFGVSVAVAGKIVAVGAGLAASEAGRVYVFTKKATGWHQSGQLAGYTADKDDFGDSVAVSGDTVVVGTLAQAPSAGRAYLFTGTVTGWHQTAELASASSTASGNEFGYSVAVSGSTVVVGAKDQESGAGRAYLFEA